MEKIDSAEDWRSENCECGLDESGKWNEKLFEQFGCNCELPFTE